MGFALRFYWVVAISGAVIMALEILSIRVLSPTFGNSVYVWGSIISVFLGAMALGYIAGGRLADRSPELSELGRLLVLAGVFIAILLRAALPMTEAVGRITGTAPHGPLLAAAVLFGPCTTLLAMVSPYAVRLAARDLAVLGNTAGRLYALSTAGSLVGTLGCTFVLIPFLDLEGILGLLLALTTVTALVAMADGLGRNRVATLLAATLLLFALLFGRASNRDRGRLVTRITPYQTLEVRETAGRRTLLSDRVEQSALDLQTGEPALLYPRYAIAALLFRPDPKRAVVLGLGGGTFERYLQSRLPELEVDFVEIDPAVPELAVRYMDFHPSAKSRVHIDDGRRFLALSDEHWDLIFCDTYIGLSVPFHHTTDEFFRLAQQRLTEDGVVMVNFAAGLDHPFTRALYATIRQVFRHAYVFDVPAVQNVVLIASDAPDRLTAEELQARARELDGRLRFDPGFEQVVATLVQVELEVGPEDILRDDFAPVDRLLHLARRPEHR